MNILGDLFAVIAAILLTGGAAMFVYILVVYAQFLIQRTREYDYIQRRKARVQIRTGRRARGNYER